MDIFLATQNRGKINEIKLIIKELSGTIGKEINLILPETKENVPELGETYKENALSKAIWWSENKKIKIPILSEDSGLEVFSLGGYPGKDSSVVPRPEATDQERCLHIIELLKDKPRRTARYVACALIYFNNTWFYDFGYTYGQITNELRGENGFGYDPIFFSYDLNKTFGEATLEEKTSVSHRKRAIFKLKPIIEKLF